MLSKTQIRILEIMTRKGLNSVKFLSSELALDRSTIYRAMKSLRKQGFLTKNRIARTNHAQLLKSVLIKYPYSFTFLAGSNMKILFLLTRPHKPSDIIRKTKLSKSQVFKTLSTLKERGILRKINNKWVLNKTIPELEDFLNSYRQYLSLDTHLPDYATMVWKGKESFIAICPKGKSLEGSLTAFSRFNEFGIQIQTAKNYYYFPKKKLNVQEIFDHSLRIADTIREKILCAVFYLKNKPKLKKNKKIEDILKGKKIEKKFLWV